MLGATFAAFDADGDGAIDARDLATVLSLARPFFAVPHSELVKKFQGMLERAGGPRGHRAKHGIERTALDSVMMYTPALEAWTLTPVRATAEWLRVRAVAESGVDARWRRTKNDAQTTAPPPPPRLKPPPRGVSRREELMGVRGLGLNATPAMRSMSKPILIKPTKPERKVVQKPIAAAPKPKLRGPQDEDDDDETKGKEEGRGIQRRRTRRAGVRARGWRTGRSRRRSSFSTSTASRTEWTRSTVTTRTGPTRRAY